MDIFDLCGIGYKKPVRMRMPSPKRFLPNKYKRAASFKESILFYSKMPIEGYIDRDRLHRQIPGFSLATLPREGNRTSLEGLDCSPLHKMPSEFTYVPLPHDWPSDETQRTVLENCRRALIRSKKHLSTTYSDGTNVDGKVLREMYTKRAIYIPESLRDIFKVGKVLGTRTLVMTPTFPKDLKDAPAEYIELSRSKFHVKISIDVNNCKEPNMPDSRSTFRIQEQLHIPKAAKVITPKEIGQTQWRTNCYVSDVPISELNIRRLEMNGEYFNDGKSNFLKDFKLVFLCEPRDLRGTYRRRMSSSDKYLTWKFTLLEE